MTWFDKLSPKAQKAYIAAHPNSKYAKSTKKPKREQKGIYGGLRAKRNNRVSSSNTVTRARSIDGKIKAAQKEIDGLTSTIKFSTEGIAKLKTRLSQLTNWAAKARLQDRINNLKEANKNDQIKLKKFKETLSILKKTKR